MSASLSIGLSGLKAAQVGLDVTSHNIANVNTPNFRRQLVDFEEVAYPTTSKTIPSGAGVAIANISNAGSPFLIKDYTDAISNSEEYNTLSALSKPLDGLLNTYDLSNAMQETFNSFQDVANNPTSIPIRQNALDKAQNLVEKSKILVNQLNNIKNGLNSSMISQMESANTLLDNISKLNKQIFNSGNQNSSLASQRDSMLLDLAKLTGINVSDDKFTVMSTSGKTLIQGGENVQYLSAEDLPNITGGSIGGTNKFINNMLNVAIADFPSVIKDLSNQINSQAVKGFDLNGKPGSAIFNVPDGTLSNFQLSINDPREIGAASTPFGSNDGTNAQEISNLKNKIFNGQTLQEKYNSLLSKFDSRVKNYNDISNAYNGITDDISKQLQNEAGVNLDEEAANLLKYQQMYSANAQVIKTQNEMFGTLINMMA